MAAVNPLSRVDLTPEERQELLDFPLGSVASLLPPNRLAVRRSIGKKLCDANTAEISDREVRDLFISHPPWKFYEDGGVPVRVYGIHDACNKMLATGTPLANFVNLTIGGRESTSAVEVEGNWSRRQIATIEWLRDDTKTVFYDPLGFFLLGPQE